MSKLKNWLATVYIASWNVSTKYPENILLNNLLGIEKNPKNDMHLHDFYVIGLQEVNSQPQNVVMGLFKEDPWVTKLKDLFSERDLVLVKSEQMQGLLIVLFAQRKHLIHLRDIETEYTRTGFGGVWGNKGAVSIRINVHGCNLCFVCSHLAAHDDMLEDRIKDYNRIIAEHKYHVKNTRDIDSHDYIFWFGDLNFRLSTDNDGSPEDIKQLVLSDKLKNLIEIDQLRLLMKNKRIFKDYLERLPGFPPTFKFEHGTSDYDLKRRPAWTDRILYKVSTKVYKNVQLTLEQKSYKSHPGYTISDHKPVSSEFTIKVIASKPIRNQDHISRSVNYTNKYVCDSNDGIMNKNFTNQIYEDVDEYCIEFNTIPLWTIGEENLIEYTLPIAYEDGGNDWVGIFKENFGSLDDYVAYEYINKPDLSTDNFMPTANVNGQRIKYILFPDSIDIEEDLHYQLLYFKSTGIRGVTSLVGISNKFIAEKRCPSPRFDSVD